MQYGDFVECKQEMNEQILASIQLLLDLPHWFTVDELKELNLNDFKVELIFRKPTDLYPLGTAGLKITKEE